MTVISYLRLATVSSLSITAEELGSGDRDDNQTAWATYPLKPPHQKTQIPRAWPLWCKSYTQVQLITMLNQLGGGYNRRYMAFTWEEARKFSNLVTNESASQRKVSYPLPLRAPTRPGTLTSRAGCHTTNGGCKECPAETFLGFNRIPRYINEVTCEQGLCSSREERGICKSAVLNQQFLYKTGKCDPHTGYEELKPYTQEIRVCCKCMIFSI